MGADHSALQNGVIGWAEKLGAQGKGSPTSDGLKKTAAEIPVKMTALNGKAFGKFCIDNEVRYHKRVNPSQSRWPNEAGASFS